MKIAKMGQAPEDVERRVTACRAAASSAGEGWRLAGVSEAGIYFSRKDRQSFVIVLSVLRLSVRTYRFFDRSSLTVGDYSNTGILLRRSASNRCALLHVIITTLKTILNFVTPAPCGKYIVNIL